jgi:hypothetical protein
MWFMENKEGKRKTKRAAHAWEQRSLEYVVAVVGSLAGWRCPSSGAPWWWWSIRRISAWQDELDGAVANVAVIARRRSFPRTVLSVEYGVVALVHQKQRNKAWDVRTDEIGSLEKTRGQTANWAHRNRRYTEQYNRLSSSNMSSLGALVVCCLREIWEG